MSGSLQDARCSCARPNRSKLWRWQSLKIFLTRKYDCWKNIVKEKKIKGSGLCANWREEAIGGGENLVSQDSRGLSTGRRRRRFISRTRRKCRGPLSRRLHLAPMWTRVWSLHFFFLSSTFFFFIDSVARRRYIYVFISRIYIPMPMRLMSPVQGSSSEKPGRQDAFSFHLNSALFFFFLFSLFSICAFRFDVLSMTLFIHATETTQSYVLFLFFSMANNCFFFFTIFTIFIVFRQTFCSFRHLISTSRVLDPFSQNLRPCSSNQWVYTHLHLYVCTRACVCVCKVYITYTR